MSKKKKDSAGGKLSDLPEMGKGFQDAFRGKARRKPDDPDYMLGYMRGIEQKNRQQLSRVKEMARRNANRRPTLLQVVKNLEGKQNDAAQKWFRPDSPEAKGIPTPAAPNSKASEGSDRMDGQDVHNLDKKEGVHPEG